MTLWRRPLATSPSGVPAWLDRLAAVGWRTLATVAFAVVLLAIALRLSTVTAALVVALLAAAVLAPLVRGLRARGIGATPAAGITALAGLAILVAAALVLALALVPSIRDIVAAVEGGVRDVRDHLVAIEAPDFVLRALDEFVDAAVGAVPSDPAALLGPASAVGTVGILGGFLTFFLLGDGDRGWAWLMQPLDGERAALVTASARAGLERMGGYLRRTTVLAVVDALVAAIVLVVLGVPLAGPLGVLVFVGGFVPYVGAVATTTVLALVALDVVGAPAGAIVILAMGVAALVASRVLDPTQLGRRVDVNPIVVLVAIFAGAALFGVIGLVALLPLTVFFLAIAKSLLVALELQPATAAASPTRLPAGVPVWLDRLAQWSWRGLVVVGLLGLAVVAAVRLPSILVPLVLALVLAATLAPLASRLRGRGWSPGPAAAAVTGGAAIGVSAAFAVSIAWTVGPLADIVDTALEGADGTGLRWLADMVASIGSEITIDIAAVLQGLGGLAMTVLLALLLTLFLLRDGPGWWSRAMDRLDGPRRAGVDAVGTRAVAVLGGYMTGTAAISAFGGVTSWLIMAILGLPLAVPVGILSFFGGFIPYIGSFLTTALAFLIAVALGTTTDVVVMGIFTVVFNIVQGNFVTPLVYGRTLSLHPAVILLAIPAGNEIAGILGMFLVVPLVAVVASTWRTALETIEPVEPTAPPSPPG